MKKEKRINLSIGDELYNHQSFRGINIITSAISSELNKKLEDLIIEGLNRKGFKFDNRIKLENFIKENCRCEDHINKKERIYYVNDIPFFLHKYENKMDMKDISGNISINYGYHIYL